MCYRFFVDKYFLIFILIYRFFIVYFQFVLQSVQTQNRQPFINSENLYFAAIF